MASNPLRILFGQSLELTPGCAIELTGQRIGIDRGIIVAGSIVSVLSALTLARRAGTRVPNGTAASARRAASTGAITWLCRVKGSAGPLGATLFTGLRRPALARATLTWWALPEGAVCRTRPRSLAIFPRGGSPAARSRSVSAFTITTLPIPAGSLGARALRLFTLWGPSRSGWSVVISHGQSLLMQNGHP